MTALPLSRVKSTQGTTVGNVDKGVAAIAAACGARMVAAGAVKGNEPLIRNTLQMQAQLRERAQALHLARAGAIQGLPPRHELEAVVLDWARLILHLPNDVMAVVTPQPPADRTVALATYVIASKVAIGRVVDRPAVDRMVLVVGFTVQEVGLTGVSP
ncbi:MAG: hypothetical protein R2838_22885 [Caldilineaceae bacterium]